MSLVDRVAFYQMKTFMQGVLQRGTARQLRHLSPYVAGKTGTTDRENDAWFIGFTNDVTIAIWVGYDNADKQRTLGGGFTGAKVAAVLLGEVDAYVHAGGQYEWDSAAPVAVARAAGLTAVRLDGSPLRYNEPDPSLPDLLVCRPELADRLLAAVRPGS